MNELPIHRVLPELRERLRSGTSAVLVAEPGAGKTTQVPLAFLNEDWLSGRKIVMLEPRRLAARSAAEYMSRMLGEQPGETIGYRVRMDSRTGRNTKIEVVTEGILTRMLQSDPELADVGMIIFDEFHERNLQGDLGLALALESRAVLREDLRILVMSATLEAEPVAALLGDASVVNCPGRQFPVETVYKPLAAGVKPEQHMAAVIREAAAAYPGDVLAFLPGAGEIRRVQAELERGGIPDGCVIRPLFGQLPQQEQDAAVRPDPENRRKWILSTSIAETSLTIDGVRIVVDSGFMRTQLHSARTGMPYLATGPASRASADQRRGRAGRTAPGVAYRLWSHEVQDHLRQRNAPEILETDLTALALELTAWGVREPNQLLWLDPPPEKAYERGTELLQRLGAISLDGAITDKGKRMAELGLHPRLSAMMLQAAALGQGGLAANLAVVLQERELFRRTERDTDIRSRAQAADLWVKKGIVAMGADETALKRIAQEIRHIRKQLRVEAGESGDIEKSGLLLSFAYPDRIGQNRGGGKFLLTSGRGVELPGDQILSRSAYITAAAVDDRQGAEGRILLAAPVSLEDIQNYHRNEIMEEMIVEWDKALGGVKARNKTSYGAVILRESHAEQPSPERVTAALLNGIKAEGLGILPWTKHAKQLRLRLQLMHTADPDWPDMEDAALLGRLEEWLLPYLHGMKSRADLQKLQLATILEQMLGWDKKTRLDKEVPTHITVPSGSKIAVDYSDPTKPVLAVKLQEMFGLHETPRIGRGKILLTLHLLSPAQRPVQITSDLASFWKNGYFDVKKDLKGRYPKHYWPDDPLEAVPTRRTRPQR
ncbi:ATP-dependent helicase HrpB [Paenibacillus sp.]|jgi:ATP-dependent helicase HrpB|uniref:ATP-dependent helicase HrpB n=1 Tax=Paenibacillus sp. TaxID=58172 RepID=UPI00282FA891|nr:ATP-dependent helicase HrpB [Paenibacillus sp.]MDR0270116.1 ATP-dependent helicase HrpB [Paenibacillus sp.]